MAEAVKSRDARRRRRILEQGSDRLAFITGRIQTLPDPQPQSHHPNTTLPTTVYDSDSTSQNPEPCNRDVPNFTNQTPPEPEGENEISTIPEPEQVQLQPPSPQQLEEPKRFIIPSDITRAFNSSRVTRLCYSILVPILVILLSYSKFFNNVIIASRPLYLVLVTNLTVVTAMLFSEKRRGFEIRDNRGSSSGSGGEYAPLARMLEVCVVAQNVADAVFMDCAVYSVVLVCGLSVLPA